MKWLNPFNRVADLVSEVVTDKDKANEIAASLEELRQHVYLAELNTRTVPWVDALHKMGRQLMSYASLCAGVYLLTVNPEINPMALAAVVGPAGIYNAVKGRGK